MADVPLKSQTPQRKLTHLRASLEGDVSFPHLTTGLDKYRFLHRALPELNWADVDLGCTFLGHSLRAPILISSMTGGAEASGDLSPHEINLRLARAAQQFGLALGVGSQRSALEYPQLAHTYQVRHVAPDILLLANLGAVQLNYGYGVAECLRVVEMIEADGLILHLNPLQEYFQPRGNLNFSGLLGKIETLCNALAVPVVAKEVGWGMSASVSTDLIRAGVSAIDVAGAGGTSWIEVEGQLTTDPVRRRVAATFADWGIPTAEALIAVREALPQTPLIASGGIRSGLDVAKSVALGADMAGIAGPMLWSAYDSPTQLDSLVERVLQELRLSMFATGSATLAQLRRPGLLSRE
jgi:isopentenyl-diphosphate delta-isomerase